MRLLLTLSMFLLVASPAAASQGRWSLSSTGDPLLSEDGVQGATAWRVCLAPAPCAPVSAGPQGETAEGTVFESDRSAPQIDTERSPAWQGRVSAVAAPGLAGSLTAGGAVHPTPAVWTGGWGDEESLNAVIACPPADRGVLSLPHRCCGTGNFGLGDRPIPAAVVGWSAYSVEWRMPHDRFFPFDGPPPAAPTTLPVPSNLVSVSAASALVAPPSVPIVTPPTLTAKAPTASIRARALRRKGRLLVGRVTLRDALHRASSTVSGGGKTLARSTSLSVVGRQGADDRAAPRAAEGERRASTGRRWRAA